MRSIFLADGHLQAHRLLAEHHHPPHFLLAGAKRGCHLLCRWLASQFLEKPQVAALEPLHLEQHMHRQANGPPMIGKSATYCLLDPPGGIGGEAESPVRVESLDCPHESESALLDEIRKGQSAPSVLLGDTDNQAQIRDKQGIARLLVSLLVEHRQHSLLLRAKERNTVDLLHVEREIALMRCKGVGSRDGWRILRLTRFSSIAMRCGIVHLLFLCSHRYHVSLRVRGFL